jgi:hypothetical protein
LNHLAALEQAGHRFSVSDLTRTECLVPVFGPGEGQRLSDFFRFFHGPNLRTVPLTAAMHTRASAIRGAYTYLAVPPTPPWTKLRLIVWQERAQALLTWLRKN